jgi:hypothetical protein
MYIVIGLLIHELLMDLFMLVILVTNVGNTSDECQALSLSVYYLR